MADVRISEVRRNLRQWEEWVARIKNLIASRDDNDMVSTDELRQLKGAPDRPHVSPCQDIGTRP
jgi:hypothetical protein